MEPSRPIDGNCSDSYNALEDWSVPHAVLERIVHTQYINH